jgi:peroxiredoxin
MQFIAALLLVPLLAVDGKLERQEQRACSKNKPVDLALQFTAPDGSSVLLKDYAGRRLVLTFWATWVRGSRSQLIALDAARDAWQKTAVDVLAVALKPESLQSVVAVQQKNRLSIKLAAAMDDTKVNETFQITVVPSTYIIDERGNIAECFAGVVSAAEVEKRLNSR